MAAVCAEIAYPHSRILGGNETSDCHARSKGSSHASLSKFDEQVSYPYWKAVDEQRYFRHDAEAQRETQCANFQGVSLREKLSVTRYAEHTAQNVTT